MFLWCNQQEFQTCLGEITLFLMIFASSLKHLNPSALYLLLSNIFLNSVNSIIELSAILLYTVGSIVRAERYFTIPNRLNIPGWALFYYAHETQYFGLSTILLCIIGSIYRVEPYFTIDSRLNISGWALFYLLYPIGSIFRTERYFTMLTRLNISGWALFY